MKKSRIIVAVFLILIGLAQPLRVMAQASQKGEKIKIVSQMFYDPLQQQYIKEKILPKFTAETGIEVELQVVANASERYKTLEAQQQT